MAELASPQFFAGLGIGLVISIPLAWALVRRAHRSPTAVSRTSEAESAAVAARAHALATQQAFRVVWDRFFEKELQR